MIGGLCVLAVTASNAGERARLSFAVATTTAIATATATAAATATATATATAATAATPAAASVMADADNPAAAAENPDPMHAPISLMNAGSRRRHVPRGRREPSHAPGLSPTAPTSGERATTLL